jgi:hypothetical protein
MRCEDCGTIMRGGYCPNCQEETVIYFEQIEPEDRKKASKEFTDKVDEQLQNAKKGTP